MADAAASRLLIVDDDPELLQLLRDELSESGWDCHVANCGGDALLQLRQERFDLVVLDWTLPDFEGIEICRRLAQQRRHHPRADAHGSRRCG